MAEFDDRVLVNKEWLSEKSPYAKRVFEWVDRNYKPYVSLDLKGINSQCESFYRAYTSNGWYGAEIVFCRDLDDPQFAITLFHEYCHEVLWGYCEGQMPNHYHRHVAVHIMVLHMLREVKFSGWWKYWLREEGLLWWNKLRAGGGWNWHKCVEEFDGEA